MGLVLVIPLLKYLVVGAGKNHQVRQWVMEFEMGMGFWRDMPTVMVLGSEGAIVLGQRMSLGTMRHSSRQAWSSILMLGPRVLGACHRLDAGDEEPNVVDNSLNKSSDVIFERHWFQEDFEAHIHQPSALLPARAI